MQLSGIVWWLTGVPFTRGLDGNPLPSWLLRRHLVKEYGMAERECRKLDQLEDQAARASETLRDRFDRRRAIANRKRQKALNALLEAGLERRCLMQDPSEARRHPFGMRLDDRSLQFYKRLLAAEAEPPPRVRVCEACDTVFATRVKGRAKKCPRCHKARKPEPRSRPWHLRSGVLETFDLHGDPHGWLIWHQAKCVSCGRLFVSKRRDQRFCSASCRVGEHRSRH